METLTFRPTEAIEFTDAQRKKFTAFAKGFKYKGDLVSVLGISRQTLWNIEKKWQANSETIRKVFTVIDASA